MQPETRGGPLRLNGREVRLGLPFGGLHHRDFELAGKLFGDFSICPTGLDGGGRTFCDDSTNFQPLDIKRLRIRNRFLSTSHSPGYATGGVVTERYVRYQAEKSRGGVGLAQFGGATAVSPENSCYYGQIDGSIDAVIEGYRRMAAAIHAHGAKCTVQLTHGGRRES